MENPGGLNEKFARENLPNATLIIHGVNQEIPGLKNTFLMKEDARNRKKVGIEHASKEVLEEALTHLITYTEKEESLSEEEFYELGLNGTADSAKKREILFTFLFNYLAK